MNDVKSLTTDHPDHLRTWEQDQFRLEMWYAGMTDDPLFQRPKVAYHLYVDGELLFWGDDYHPSPMFAIDSDIAVAELLSFLSLGEWDTDEEYFENYTEDQLTFRDSFAREELSFIAFEMEEEIGAR